MVPRAMDDGLRRFFVVCTRPRGFRRRGRPNRLYDAFFWRRPRMRAALDTWSRRYNAELDRLERLEAEGRAYVFYAEDQGVENTGARHGQANRGRISIVGGDRRRRNWKTQSGGLVVGGRLACKSGGGWFARRGGHRLSWRRRPRRERRRGRSVGGRWEGWSYRSRQRTAHDGRSLPTVSDETGTRNLSAAAIRAFAILRYLGRGLPRGRAASRSLWIPRRAAPATIAKRLPRERRSLRAWRMPAREGEDGRPCSPLPAGGLSARGGRGVARDGRRRMGKATRRRGAAFLLTAVLLSCALALAGCTGGAGGDKAGASGEGTLRVGVRSDVVGFGYLNENTGKYYGLEIDIAGGAGAAPGLRGRGVRVCAARDAQGDAAGRPGGLSGGVLFRFRHAAGELRLLARVPTRTPPSSWWRTVRSSRASRA